MDSQVKELIAIGASVTANCQPCLTFHADAARRCGAVERDIAMAIAVGKSVRKGAAAKMDDFAASISRQAEDAPCGTGGGCACGSD